MRKLSPEHGPLKFVSFSNHLRCTNEMKSFIISHV